MKNGYILLILIGVFSACTPVQYSTWKSPDRQPAVVVDNNNEVTDQTFYDELAPDGRWISDPELGYVWSPNVGNDFRPYYTNGHWTYTNYGWTWVSDYNWGWATFHYGRWKFDNAYGWVWAPGHEWAPAWVQWRKTPDAYGWAPLEPGISIEVGFSTGYHIPDNRWAFVPQQHFDDRDFHKFVPPVQQNNVYINRSTIINNNITINNVHNTTINNDNRKYIAGPEINEVRHVTNQNIEVHNIQNNNRPGNAVENGNAINMYRPMVRDNNNNSRLAPKSIVNQPNAADRQQNFRNLPNNQDKQTLQNGHQPNNQTKSIEQTNTQYQQNNTQNQQAPPKRWNNNNPSIQTPNQPTTPVKQDEKPVLNPSENHNRMPGDATPYNPNNNGTTRQQNRNDQPKNEQPLPNNQQQTPKPNNMPTQNYNVQQRQPGNGQFNKRQNNENDNQQNNGRYQPNTPAPVNKTPQQQYQPNQNKNNPVNPNAGTNLSPVKPLQRQPLVKPKEEPKTLPPTNPVKTEKPVQ